MTPKIVAVLGESVPAFRVEIFSGYVCLRAICLPCERPVYYEKRSGGELGWHCKNCDKDFNPERPIDCTNYFPLYVKEERHTAPEWVAKWWGCSPEVVEVTWK